MPEDSLTNSLAEALRDLVMFVENRPDDATADDDVRALEDFAYVLNQLAPVDKNRARALLGEEIVAMLGWNEQGSALRVIPPPKRTLMPMSAPRSSRPDVIRSGGPGDHSA